MTIVDDYLDKHEKYSAMYGGKTIVLMQVGSFHEAYSTDIKGPDLRELEKLFGFKHTRKNNNIEGPPSTKNPNMIGFPSIKIVKWTQLLTENGYTVVVYDQIPSTNSDRKDKLERVLVGIYSSGTIISDKQNEQNNYIMAVYVCEEKQFSGDYLHGFGVTLVDIGTEASIVNDFCSNKYDRNFGYDELVRMIQTFNPTESVIYYHTDDNNQKRIEMFKSYIQLDKINHKFFVYHNKTPSDRLNLITEKSFDTSVQNDLFSKTFGINRKLTLGKNQSPLEIMNLLDKPYATISLTIMINYIKQHNIKLLKNINIPTCYIYNKHLILGNNAIEQLNIVDSNKLETFSKRFQSLFDVVNNTLTSLGKRFLRTNLLNPMSQKCKKEMLFRYDAIEELLKYLEKDSPKIKFMMNYLKNIFDIERIHKRMSIGLTTPSEFYKLHSSYQSISMIIKILEKNNILCKLLDQEKNNRLNEFIEMYQSHLNIEELRNFDDFSKMEKSIFNSGVYEEIDNIYTDIEDVKCIISSVISEFSKIINSNTKSKFNREAKDVVSVEYNKNEGYFFSTTKNRIELLRQGIKKGLEIRIKQNKSIIVNSDDLEIKHRTTGKSKITISSLNKKMIKYSSNVEILGQITKKYFSEKMSEYYNNYSDIMEYVSYLISKIDFLVSGAITAHKYYYCKPNIPNKKNVASYFNAKSIRHAIVERINSDTEYIPNDLELGNGKSYNGMLLYGLNSGGKTTLMKSIGIAIILAQIGYFVPASEFNFEPYMAIYARITGNDNLFKGLSSFALEMTELEAILKRTVQNGENVMVIGDEICRGTEDISGRAIVASTLSHLSRMNTTFIFSSHLHDLPTIEEVKVLKNMRLAHLEVSYDKYNDCLIFNRKLKDGSGPSVYGLMVAKYLVKDNEFINMSEKIKERLLNNIDNSKIKKSKYNSDLLMDECKVCGYKPTKSYHKDLETHHINFQKDCDKNGKIINKPHLHKNGMYNLVPLCRSCHNKIDTGIIVITGYKDTSKGPMLDYEINSKKIFDNEMRMLKEKFFKQ